MDVRCNMTMHWRSLTIVLEAYHIYDQMLLHLGQLLHLGLQQLCLPQK